MEGERVAGLNHGDANANRSHICKRHGDHWEPGAHQGARDRVAHHLSLFLAGQGYGCFSARGHASSHPMGLIACRITVHMCSGAARRELLRQIS